MPLSEFALRPRERTHPSERLLRYLAVGMTLSTALTGCLFSSGPSSSGVTSTTTSSTRPEVAGVTGAVSVGAGAATVPDTYVPGQPAPTVPLAEAQAAQLKAADSATTVPAALSPLAPITALLATAQKGLLTAEAASRNLWDSWQDKDWERASLYASTDAVKSLFALPWRPETVDHGCRPSPVPEMAARCLFVQGSVVKILDVKGSAGEGYKVARVSTARQATPVVSALPVTPGDPSVSIDPDVAGPLPDAGIAATPGAGSVPVPTPTVLSARRPATTSPRQSAAKTKKSPATGASGGQVPPPTADPSGDAPTTPTSRPAGGGVPAGAPVVSQVE